MARNPEALIIGAGPVGLAMACELIRHGLTCRIIDQNPKPAVWSKAQIVHARTLEIFESMGVVETILSCGKKVHALNLYSDDLARVAHVPIEGMTSHFGFTLSISQHDTERILAKHLKRLGVMAERGVRLTGFLQDDTGVTAVLVGADGQLSGR